MVENKKITKKVKKNGQGQLKELTELLQRKQAELENYRKQTEKRFGEIREYAVKDIILQILPIIDNFELALKNTENKEEFVEGIKLINSQLFEILGNNEIKVMETKNKMFDPNYHEALMKVESKLPETVVVEELQKGFILNDKVIRHAKVKISVGGG